MTKEHRSNRIARLVGMVVISGSTITSSTACQDLAGANESRFPTTVDSIASFDADDARALPDVPGLDHRDGDDNQPLEAPPIAVFKDFDAWVGEARVEMTLRSEPFNLVAGEGYAVYPTIALLAGIPEGTEVAIITSNSQDRESTALNVRSETAQAAIADFASSGGTVIMHLADNMPEDGRFFAPGMHGPRLEDGRSNDMVVLEGSSSFHAGLDGELGTADDATTESVAWLNSEFAHHGSVEGCIPDNATVLMTSGEGNAILAEYPFGAGRIVVGTLTFEFGNEIAPGLGFGHRDLTLINHVWNGVNPAPPPDTDGDGVTDDVDVCADTVMPEDAPSVCLIAGRYSLLDDSGVFTTLPGEDGREFPEFTIEDTAGCSCTQIVENMGLSDIHLEHGCHLGAMVEWVDLVSE